MKLKKKKKKKKVFSQKRLITEKATGEGKNILTRVNGSYSRKVNLLLIDRAVPGEVVKIATEAGCSNVLS